MQAAVIDPVKVVRLALQNAASIAALLLTTEVAALQAPEADVGAGHGQEARMY